MKFLRSIRDGLNLYTMSILEDNFKKIDKAIESLNHLVAEGQLTPAQYGQLISIINGNISKGNVTVDDIDLNQGKITQNMIADSLLQIMAGNAPINAVPENNSITTNKMVDESITRKKRTIGGELATITFSGKPPNINTVDRVVEVQAGSYVNTSKNRYDILNDVSAPFYRGLNSIVMYDTATNVLSVNHGSSVYAIPESAVVLMYINFTTTSQSSVASVACNFEYTLNGETSLRDDSVTTKKILDGAILPSKTSFIEMVNLFNKKDVISGYSVNATTGELTPVSNQNTSEFIEIGAGTQITIVNASRVTYYDSENNLIRSFTSSGVTKTTTDARTAKLRFTTHNARIDGAMLYLGHDDKEYEPYAVKVLGHDISGGNGGNTFDINDDHLIEGLEPDEIYLPEKQSDVSTDSPNNLKLLTPTDINGEFEALTSTHSHYVTKTDTVTAFGHDINAYEFIPRNNRSSSLTSAIKMPKIMIVNGMHGSEKTAVWAGMQGMKDIVLNWKDDPTLEFLRWNAHIIYIPLANPSGWEYDAGSGNKSGTRKNNNGVDLARNFPTGWSSGDPDSAVYGGPSPLSEIESQFINDIYEEHKADLIYAAEFHNYFALGEGFIWNASNSRYQVNMGESIVRSITARAIKDELYDVDEASMLGHADLGSPNGSFSRHVSSDNIPGSTFEVGERVFFEENPVMNSPTAIQWGTAAYVNWLMLLTKNAR